MDILFATDRLERLCTDDRTARKELGRDGAKKLRRRLDDLDAAPSLATLRALPGQCHELKGDRDGCLAVRLHGGWRFVFEPADEPVPRKPDGGLEWERVTAVRVVAVEDYHD